MSEVRKQASRAPRQGSNKLARFRASQAKLGEKIAKVGKLLPEKPNTCRDEAVATIESSKQPSLSVNQVSQVTPNFSAAQHSEIRDAVTVGKIDRPRRAAKSPDPFEL